MTRSRSFPLTIPILAVGLVGMCGFLWFEYRQAKQKALPPRTLTEKNLGPILMSSPEARQPRNAAIVSAMKTSLSGTAETLTEAQVAQLTRLLAVSEDNRLSPEIIFGAQRFLTPAQVTALKTAYAGMHLSPAPPSER